MDGVLVNGVAQDRRSVKKARDARALGAFDQRHGVGDDHRSRLLQLLVPAIGFLEAYVDDEDGDGDEGDGANNE